MGKGVHTRPVLRQRGDQHPNKVRGMSHATYLDQTTHYNKTEGRTTRCTEREREEHQIVLREREEYQIVLREREEQHTAL